MYGVFVLPLCRAGDGSVHVDLLVVPSPGTGVLGSGVDRGPVLSPCDVVLLFAVDVCPVVLPWLRVGWSSPVVLL